VPTNTTNSRHKENYVIIEEYNRSGQTRIMSTHYLLVYSSDTRR